MCEKMVWSLVYGGNFLSLFVGVWIVKAVFQNNKKTQFLFCYFSDTNQQKFENQRKRRHTRD